MDLVLTGCELVWFNGGCRYLEVSFYELSASERFEYEAMGYAVAQSIRDSHNYGLF